MTAKPLSIMAMIDEPVDRLFLIFPDMVAHDMKVIPIYIDADPAVQKYLIEKNIESIPLENKKLMMYYIRPAAWVRMRYLHKLLSDMRRISHDTVLKLNDLGALVKVHVCNCCEKLIKITAVDEDPDTKYVKFKTLTFEKSTRTHDLLDLHLCTTCNVKEPKWKWRLHRERQTKKQPTAQELMAIPGGLNHEQI
jgi:hypothetical protein